MDDSLDVLSVLSDSPHRLAILRQLATDPCGVGDLSDALDLPRATVTHNLTRLEETGLVCSIGSEYDTTAFGRAVRTHVTDCLDAVAVSETLQPFLATVPDDAIDVDHRTFAGASVTAVSSTDPHAPVERLVEILGDADYLRVATPVLLPRLVDALHSLVVDRSGRLDLVVPRTAVELFEQRHPDAYTEAIGSDRLIAGVTADPIPYGLYLGEDRLALVGHDEQNIPRCVVEADATSALDWAAAEFRGHETAVETHVWGADV